MATGTISPIEALKKYRVIAVVGASRSQQKAAYTVPRYLKDNGYQIIPVNPAATEVLGERAYPSLLELPEETAKNVQIVEVFRPSDELAAVALEVVEMKKRYGRPYVFWAQQGLESEEAKRILEGNHILYVMDSCMRTVHQVYVKK